MSILKTLISVSNQKLILPFYHSVSDATIHFSNHLYHSKSVNEFKKELNVLLKYFQPISLEELIHFKKTKQQIKKPCFHLTFDDGLSNFYHVIAPILKEKNISATIFLNTDFIDNKDLFYRYKANILWNHYKKVDKNIKQKFEGYIQNTNVKNYLFSMDWKNRKKLEQLAKAIDFDFNYFLDKEKPYLTIDQIKSLQKDGFTFGAHSCNHPKYSEIDLAEQLQQTNNSLSWLQLNLAIDYNVFSFPFNDIGVSKSFFEQIKPEVDLTFGTSGLKKDEIDFNLQRLDMEKNTGNAHHFLIKRYFKSIIRNLTLSKSIKRK